MLARGGSGLDRPRLELAMASGSVTRGDVRRCSQPQAGYTGPLPVFDVLSLFAPQPLLLEDSMELQLEF